MQRTLEVCRTFLCNDGTRLEVGESTNLAPNPGFESSGSWSAVKSSAFPATSIWRGTWGTGDQHSGSYAYAISNHAYGYVQSAPIAVSANTQYDLHAWVRGELDPDDSAKSWLVRASFYDASGSYISYQDAASGGAGSLSTTWQKKGGTVTTPANAATMRIQLYNFMNSGWAAFDDVSLVKVGESANLAPNPGFESSSSWSVVKSSSFPATSIWRGTWGTGDQHSGSYAYVISNHAYGYVQSDPIAVSPNTQYDLHAWVRGELDPDDSAKSWLVRASFYDASGSYISYQDAASSGAGTLSTTWQQKGGAITTPSNAATMRIQLFNYMNSGWAAFDDVTLVAHEQVTKYYYAAGQRIAMRKDGVVYYLHGDHGYPADSLHQPDHLRQRECVRRQRRGSGPPALHPLRRGAVARSRRDRWHITNRLHVHRAEGRVRLWPDGL